MKYETDMGKTELDTEATVNSYTFSGDGTLYYFTSTDARYKAETGKAELIRACDEETMYAVLSCDGTRIYLDNRNNRFYYNEASEHRIFVCDLEGKLINSIPGGINITELADGDNLYTKAFAAGENGGEFRSYIKNSELTAPNAEWMLVDRQAWNALVVTENRR